MTRKLIFLLILIASISAVTIAAQTPKGLVKIYDSVSAEPENKATEKEKQFVEAELSLQEKKLIAFGDSTEFKCDDIGFYVNGAVSGSFTRPRAKQRAFLYHYCWSEGGRYALGLGGLVIAENGKVVAHHAYKEVSGFNFINALPDIDRDGRNEILLRYEHQISGLSFKRSVEIFEVGADKLVSLGSAETYDNSLERVNEGGESPAAYPLFVRPGKSPAFFRRMLVETEDGKWKPKGGLKRVRLGKGSEASFARLDK